MEDQLRLTLPKIVGMDETQNSVQRKMLDPNHGFEGVRAGLTEQMSQMETFITQGFARQTAAATPQPAPQAPPMSADVRGADPFTVHGVPWDRSTGVAEQIYVGMPVRSAGPGPSRPHQR